MTEPHEAEVLYGNQLKRRITELIESAQKTIIVVCPYVRLHEVETIAEALRGALKRGVSVTMFVRNEPKQLDTAVSQHEHLMREGMSFLAVKDLHAKIYMSESRVIVGSVNLLGTSFKHGLEIGVEMPQGRLHGEVRSFIKHCLLDDTKVVSGQKPDLNMLLQTSAEPVVGAPGPARQVPQVTGEYDIPSETKADAHCIRCGTGIPLDLTRPFCDKDAKTWARYKDEDYEESVCHICGGAHATSKRKPMCRTCYQKNKGAAKAAGLG